MNQSPTKKILQAFLASFVALLVIVCLIAFFLPKTYEARATIEINAPVSSVFPLISDFSQWKTWSPWYDIEPSAQFDASGELAQVNSHFNWKGKIIGEGRMVLNEVIPNQKLVLEMQFEKPEKKHSISEFTFQSAGNDTAIVWKDVGDLSYPIGRLFRRNISDMLSQDLKHGLETIKLKAEKQSSKD